MYIMQGKEVQVHSAKGIVMGTPRKHLPLMPIGKKKERLQAKSKTKEGKYKSKVWNDGMYVRVFQLAKEDLNNKQIAESLGVTQDIFKDWINSRPYLRVALETARAKDGKTETFSEYIYKKLSPEVKEI